MGGIDLRVIVVLFVLTITSLPVLGQGLQSMQVATALGSIIASEQYCGLAYDQGAIAAYIESKVPADDMSFPSTLQMMVAGAEFRFDEMSASAKTAHCTQISRVAKSYNFIQ